MTELVSPLSYSLSVTLPVPLPTKELYELLLRYITADEQLWCMAIVLTSVYCQADSQYLPSKAKHIKQNCLRGLERLPAIRAYYRQHPHEDNQAALTEILYGNEN